MDRPSFLILGAPKCGTTTLHAWLDQHPDICMSRPKETGFFLLRPEAPMKQYWNNHFRHWDGEAAAGEATPFYLSCPTVLPRLREVLPDARLIALLRDPVDRAYAQWWHNRTGGWEDLSFADAIGANFRQREGGIDMDAPDSAPHWQAYLRRMWGEMPVRNYVEVGHYALHLRRVLRFYPRSQLRVYFLRDLDRQPLAVLRDVWSFLGLVEPSKAPNLRTENRAPGIAMRYLKRIPMVRQLSPFLPESAKDVVRSAARVVSPPRPAMPPEPVVRLRKHFAPHNEDLADVLGHPVAGWERPAGPEPSLARAT